MDSHPRSATRQPRSTRFIVGRDHHGWWVVHDHAGLVGGIFASEDAAMHFAMEECRLCGAKVRRAGLREIVELDGMTRDGRQPAAMAARRSAAGAH